MDSCRSFHTYTGQRKPRCNGGNPCTACSLLHFLVWYIHKVEPKDARTEVEEYLSRRHDDTILKQVVR